MEQLRLPGAHVLFNGEEIDPERVLVMYSDRLGLTTITVDGVSLQDGETLTIKQSFQPFQFKLSDPSSQPWPRPESTHDQEVR